MPTSKAESARASLKARIVRQFRQPAGNAGRLAGWIMATRPSNRLRNRRTLELLEIAPDDTVLELGYGPGFAVELAAARLRGGRLIGLDHSPVMLAQATRRNARAIASGTVSLRLGDVLDPAMELPSFDKIYSVNVVQFWPEPRRVFASLKALLNPRGAIATTYMPRVGSNKERQAKAKAEELAVLMRAIGFDHVETHWLTAHPAPAFCVLARTEMH